MQHTARLDPDQVGADPRTGSSSIRKPTAAEGVGFEPQVTAEGVGFEPTRAVAQRLSRAPP
jgi:hypothetical protein